MTPRKPNSARRKVARVKLIKTGEKIYAYIPGQGHNLKEYSMVMVEGKRSCSTHKILIDYYTRNQYLYEIIKPKKEESFLLIHMFSNPLLYSRWSKRSARSRVHIDERSSRLHRQREFSTQTTSK
jgi:hypothetical protein